MLFEVMMNFCYDIIHIVFDSLTNGISLMIGHIFEPQIKGIRFNSLQWRSTIRLLGRGEYNQPITDQTEKILKSNSSEEKSTMMLDRELKEMLERLEKLSMIDSANMKDRIADLFQQGQLFVQYLKQQDPHDDTRREALQRYRDRFQEILDNTEYLTPPEPSPEQTEEEKHACLNWTACYKDECVIHHSEKMGANWFPKKPRHQGKASTRW